MIYLDYSATTPVDKEVLNTFVSVTENFIGNPNSLHCLGLQSKKIIDAATAQITEILNIEEKEIIYTSGATESNNTAILGVCLKYQNRGKHILTTKLEHSSINKTLEYLETLNFEIEYIEIDEFGQIDLVDFKNKLREDTILVTISSVNSEIGLIQPLEKITKILKDYPKIYFHSDMTQSIGKEKVNLKDIDLVSFSAQKFYGLKGIGCLLKNKNIIIEPLIHGGKSTTIYRSGTPSPALIVSTAKALRLQYENFSLKQTKVKELHDYLIDNLQKLDISINSNSKCIPHIINISLNNIKPETMLHALEQEEIYISTKTACSTEDTSDAVYALTLDNNKSKHSLRISISHLTTKEELDIFIDKFSLCLKKLQILTK